MNKREKLSGINLPWGEGPYPSLDGEPVDPKTEPEIIKKFKRPDGSIVEYHFRVNQYGEHFVSAKEKNGDSHRIAGNLGAD